MSTSLGRKIVNINGVNVIKNMPDELFVASFNSSEMVAALVKKKIRKRLGE
jgi:hypothetical protein